MNRTSVPQHRDDVSRPELTDSQRATILTGVSELVRAAVSKGQPKLTDPTWAGAGEIPVYGCFVSIKRKGRLRGCCGFLGHRANLRDALAHSAKLSATGDVRMPSVVEEELQYLDFEVWLLYGKQPITVKGTERIDVVEIGRHGLQMEHQEARGLLLPGVATDLGLDSERFLQQVSLKAGLPADSWKEDEARLWTFEGVRVDGRFDATILRAPSSPRKLLSDNELSRLVEFCRNNIYSISRGAVPDYYLADCSDGNVHGISIVARLASSEQLLSRSHLQLRNQVPLQATVFQLCEKLGGRLREAGISPARDEIDIQLGLLSQPAMHGTVSDPDLGGLSTANRAVLVHEGQQSAWIYDPQSTPEQLVNSASQMAGVTMPEGANVVSLVAQASATPMRVANAAQPQQGAPQRPPAVAGRFYPGDADQLKQMVEQLVPTRSVPRKDWRAALVPHAGLVFSGRIAADVLRRCKIPKKVIVIGPKHTRLGVNWAVAPHDQWQLPGITIASDRELAQQLCDSVTGLKMDAAAHQAEHAIEVELPWLARFAPESQIVGIAVGRANLAMCRQFAEGMANVIGDHLDDVLLVISTDMNHFADDQYTRQIDRLAIEAMEACDPEKLFHVVRRNNISMCGVLPAVIVLECLRILKQLSQAETVAYGTSADVSGDRSRVVGYAGMLFR